MLCTNKCNKQVQQTNWILYYWLLTFARSRASYSQTCSETNACATPAQRKPERPVFQPRDKSSGIRHCWHRTNQPFITMNKVTRVQGLHRHSDTTPAQGSSMLTAKQPEEAEYPRQRNNDGGGELHSAGTLAGTRILARKLRILDKQAIMA